MRAVVQRVTQASVTVDGELLGRIGKGLLILLGVADGDTRELTEKDGRQKFAACVFLRMRTARRTVRWRMWMARSC